MGAANFGAPLDSGCSGQLSDLCSAIECVRGRLGPRTLPFPMLQRDLGTSKRDRVHFFVTVSRNRAFNFPNHGVLLRFRGPKTGRVHFFVNGHIAAPAF